MRVAVVGVGRMGAAMAARLCARGAEVVVYNRTAAKAEQAAAETGAVLAATAREAAAGADVVLVSLADDAACLQSYPGPDGIAAGVRPGTVVVDTSTIAPRTVQQLARIVGSGLLDAPVSGSVPVVERGELAVMVGGSAAHLDQVRPVLNLLARQVFHVGAQGAGAVMKLVVNSVVYALNQSLAEALVLAERAGVDRSTAYDVFTGSVIAAPFVAYKRPAFTDPGGTPVAFSLDLVAKDLDLILNLAREVGASMDQAETNRDAVAAALSAGLGQCDMSDLAQLLRSPP